jgi:hypothetical protein
LRPKVLSSTTFCFLSSFAFDSPAFFGGIMSRSSDSRCREGRFGSGDGQREEEEAAARRRGKEGFVGLGLPGRKGKAEARRKFLEVLVVTWRCGGTGLDGGCGYWAARGRGCRRGGSRARRICVPEVDVVVLAGRRLVGQIKCPRSSIRRPRAEDGGREVCVVPEQKTEGGTTSSSGLGSALLMVRALSSAA